MFKERLKVVGMNILYGVMVATVLLLILSVFIGLLYLGSKFLIVETIIGYIIYSFVGLILLTLLGNIILRVYMFIKWLFIEPYREKKKMKS